MDTGLVSRRTLIRGGLAIGAALGVGGTVWLPPAADGYRALSVRETEIVGALADTLFPRGALPIDPADVGVVAEVDRILTEVLPSIHATGFRYLLRTLEWGTLASRGRACSDLTREDRAEVLAVWSEPTLLPRRVAGDVLKMVLAMAYFSNLEVLKALGYTAPCGMGPA